MMTKKSMVFSVVLATFSAVLAAGLTIYGSQLLGTTAELAAERSQNTQTTSEQGQQDAEIHFVDIKNIVITLTSTGRGNHYLLLDLAVTTSSEAQAEKVNSTIALIKSSTVNLLTNMNYETLNQMHVSELRQKLLDEYRSTYSSLNLTVPFSDVMISKMVFQ